MLLLLSKISGLQTRGRVLSTESRASEFGKRSNPERRVDRRSEVNRLVIVENWDARVLAIFGSENYIRQAVGHNGNVEVDESNLMFALSENSSEVIDK